MPERGCSLAVFVLSCSSLRHNVIKTGLRKINLAYSRISIQDICHKLHFESEEEAEYIIAKAISDGVIEATIDSKERCLFSKVRHAYCSAALCTHTERMSQFRSLSRAVVFRRRTLIFIHRTILKSRWTSVFVSVWRFTTAPSSLCATRRRLPRPRFSPRTRTGARRIWRRTKLSCVCRARRVRGSGDLVVVDCDAVTT